MEHRAALPSVPHELAAHSARVTEHLRHLIELAGGAITFANFMQAALYAPGLGYYSAGARKFGADGDFTTAPEISPLFGAVIARQCRAVLEHIPDGVIVEYGAGTGQLACDVLQSLQAAQCLPAHYYIVEVSADLRERQRDAIAACVPALLPRVQWLNDPSSVVVDGIIIGNEVLDALPVERFRMDSTDGVQQQYAVVHDGTLALDWQPASASLRDAVDAVCASLVHEFTDGYVSEICVQLPAWLSMVAATLRRGVVLFSDYGYGRTGYYAPDRTSGTLTCHFRHHVHDDVLHAPGCQDITAWVDFTQVAESLRDSGLDYLGFTTQAQFLLHGGLTQAVEAFAHDGENDPLALSAGIKTLTLPGEMGERFKFMGFARACDVLLPGFSGRDFGQAL